MNSIIISTDHAIIWNTVWCLISHNFTFLTQRFWLFSILAARET